MVSRFLITTADERTWPGNQPVLFLGEWCRLYNRKAAWQKLDAEVVPYHWDDRGKLYRDYCYLMELHERILPEVANRLNEIHVVNHSLRYWRILIGPWLGYFIQMVFDRWEMIQSAVKRYEISGARVIEGDLARLAPNDMDDFAPLFTGDQWNQAIYGYILEHWTDVHCERVKCQSPELLEDRVCCSAARPGFAKGSAEARCAANTPHRGALQDRSPSPPAMTRRLRLRRFITGMASKVLAMRVRPDEAFFIADYLPLRESFALQWQLGQIPRRWRKVAPPAAELDIESRRWHLGDTSDSEAPRGSLLRRSSSGYEGQEPQGNPPMADRVFAKPSDLSGVALAKTEAIRAKEGDFEQALRALIPLQIPTVYLEGYGDLKKQVSALPWPQSPRFIFTSNLHISDDVFKAWTAEKVEAGSPLVIGQHGGLYGSGLWFFFEEHEIAVSDRYLSWGWEDGGNNKIKPVGNLKMFGRRLGWDPDGCAFMVEMAMPRYSYHMYSVPVASQWLGYFDDQSRFVAALPRDMRGQLLVRLFSQDYDWRQKQRWQDRFPQIRLDDGVVPIASLIEKSRLYISTYNSTTFLESLAMNIPTIMFWNPEHWELRASAQPYYDRLKVAGIFHETPESAAAKVAEVWNDVSSWWNQPEIQEARLYFCDRFARMPKNPLRVLKDALTTVKPGGLN